MKKILFCSAALMSLALSLTIFQISCQKPALAQSGNNYILPIASTTNLGGVKPDGITIVADPTGTISTVNKPLDKLLYTEKVSGVNYIWVINNDGTNAQQLSINLPAGLTIGEQAKLIPQSDKVVFSVYTGTNSSNSSTPYYLFSCSLDGSNLTKLVTSSTPMIFQGAF